jgi:subtilisin
MAMLAFMSRCRVLVAALLLLAGPAFIDSAFAVTQAQRDRLIAKANQDGWIRLIVHIRTPVTQEHLLERTEVTRQRARVSLGLDTLRQRIHGPGLQLFDPIPGMAAAVLVVDRPTLLILLDDPAVLAISEDRLARPQLSQSAPMIGAPQVWASGFSGFTGAGQTIAVIDTGVDKNHPFFGGRVVGEMCFSTTALISGLTLFPSTSLCPNGQSSQSGPGSGVNCSTAIAGCEHGTHVAGIAAGFQSSSLSGIAPGAGIISAQVFSRFSKANCGTGATSDCAFSYESDQIKALQRLYDLRDAYRIAAVNISISGDHYSSQQDCDDDNVTYKAAIDALRAVGIPTIISAGNEGAANAIGTPSCISSAFAVGSVDKNGAVSSFSNSSPMVRMLAPGGSINSSVPGGGFGVESGTSMAAPHVAGSFALLRSARVGATIDQIVGALTASGPRIFYSTQSGGQTLSYSPTRIQANSALALLDSIPPVPEAGWWWNPAEAGRGFAIEVREGRLFFATYLYDSGGRATWLVATGPMSGASFTGDLQAFINGQSLVSGYQAPQGAASPGRMTLQFTGARTATLTWPGGTVPLQRFSFSANGPDTPRQPFAPENGWWWNAAENGRGYTIEVQGTAMFFAAFMYRADGSPVWYVATGSMTDNFTFVGQLNEYSGGQSLTGTYRPAAVQQSTGAMTLQFQTTTSARLILPSGRILDITRYRF